MLNLGEALARAQPLLEGLAPCDSLYLSPHADDAALSCASRMLAESSRGERVLIADLFGEGPPAGVETASSRLGAEVLRLGWPEAREREPRTDGLNGLFRPREPGDEDLVSGLCRLLADLVSHARPRRVYAPLGVWGHLDHRLVHEASLRTLESGKGRDVFLYEERPVAWLPSAVRLRLGELGVRLPPGAPFKDRGGLTSYLLRFPLDPFVRMHSPRLLDRLGLLSHARRQWRESRGWMPHRSFGPRLQPVLQAASEESLARLFHASTAFPKGSPFGTEKRFTRLAESYARRLGSAAPVERYWLVLPSREDVPSRGPFETREALAS